MIQRLLLLSAALSALFCESALGVGLGNLELNSALNQEFSAEIPLTNTDSLAMEEILSHLGTQEDFDRVGVNRNFLLTDLRFKVVEKDDGSKAVRITSTRPIVEPYLNFIVEVLWPSGRILREYTVLLDPPVFGQQGVARIEPGQISRRTPEATSRPPASTVPESSVARTQTSRETRTDIQVRTSNDEVASGEGRIVDDEYGMTGRGDTLWEIAMNVRPNDSISVQQTMLALQRANPDAFINNNINLLKVGYVIRIPDRSEFQRETFSDAVAEVKIQNREFEEYKGNRVTQLDATRRSPQSGGTERGSADDGTLKLLAADRRAGQRAGDGDADARAEALEDELSVAREDLDLANRENAALNVRMKDLADQIETMTELVQVQDEQLAALRASIAQSQNAEAKTPAETKIPAETKTASAATTPPVVTTQTPAKTDLLTQALSLLSNPLVVGGLALLLIGSVVGGMIFVHRRQQASAFDDDDFAEVVLADSQPELEEEEEFEDSDEPEAVEEDDDDEVLAPQTGDVISEVEIYIAYGEFSKAVTFLRNAIEAEPDRADIQLKLLDVYVQTEDATAFKLQLRQLKLLEDDAATAQAEELEKQLSGAADSSGDDAEFDDDDDLSFDLDDLDSETDDDELDLDDSEGLELDIDLGLDEADEPGAAAESADADDEFELDLDLDADLDLDDDLTSLEVDGSEPELEDDEITLDLGDDDDDLTLSLDDDDDLTLNLEDDDDDDLSLSLDDDDDLTLNLDDDDDDDALTLDLDADDDFNLEEELELDSQDQELDGEVELSIGEDDELELDLDDIDLGSDLEDDSLDLDLDDLGELNLDEDASTKLDLARAYLDMGDTDGVKSLLEEVISEGSESDVKKANELMEQLD